MNHELTLLITIVAAVGFGLFAQLLAHRWHIPAIVLLLGFGIALGESGVGIVRSNDLGEGLGILVKLAVAIILFEGALNLNLKSLRQSAVEVRNLVTIGVLISWGITTFIARYVAGFEWQIAILFGSLMTVTGPTVVQPLLRRIVVSRRLKTILEGEAILIDPIGAILAIAVLDVLVVTITHGASGFLELFWAYFGRILVGGLIGTLGALTLSRLMKTRNLVPSELSNLVALACVWSTFGLAEWIQSEAGIMAAVAMGLILQNESIPGVRQLRHFKETLTTLGISMLFILLAAKLDVSSVWAEGASGLAAVLLIMFVARPISVFFSTWGSTLNWREKTFIAWVGPRGIIAASVASIFAVTFEEFHLAGGERLLALTFLTILLTVTMQGLSAGQVARLLGLQSLEGQKVIIVGANRLGRTIAKILQERGRPTLLLDTNHTSVEQAGLDGLSAIFGNALEEETLETLHAEEIATLLAVTSNSEVNVLACQLAHDAFGVKRAFPALANPAKGANPRLLNQTGGKLAFGRFVKLADWEFSEKALVEVSWSVPKSWSPNPLSQLTMPADLLPVIRLQGNNIEIVHAEQIWQTGDSILFLSTLSLEKSLDAMKQSGLSI